MVNLTNLIQCNVLFNCFFISLRLIVLSLNLFVDCYELVDLAVVNY